MGAHRPFKNKTLPASGNVRDKRNVPFARKRNEIVEKLAREKFTEVGSRLEALEPIFSELPEFFDLPILRFLQKTQPFR
jgi:hypothetical protein